MPSANQNPSKRHPRTEEPIRQPRAKKSQLPPVEHAPAAGAEYFEILARATNDAIRDWDVGSGGLTWPRGLESLLGHRAAGADKVSFWLDHIHPDDLGRIQDSLRETFASRTERWMGDYRFRRGNGEYIHVLDRALIERDAEGAARRAVCLMMDVTAREQMQAQACRSQRMEAFGQLAGGVAHDFNNFLTTILGYSDLILSERGVRGQLERQITEIRDAAGRATSLTNQLLAFSRRQSLEPTVLEINAFLTNLEESLLHLLGENISITCDLHHLKEGAHVRADAGQLTQIILNLAVNARDAMRKGGRLTIETSVVRLTGGETACAGRECPPGEYVTLVMSDTGTGMSEEVKARLFEPFFTTKAKGNRNGLGLATSYGIVRQSGGHICAESVLGKGTTFRIFLPRVPAPPAPYKKRHGAKMPTGTESVLVLEDDVSVRHLSVHALRRLGYEVIEAARGEDAKRLMAQRGKRPIDLLLTDLVMPEMSGRNFADWLIETSPRTKVIFISGYLDESLHPGDRRDPKMCFLAKPFNVQQLASKVREVLDG
jgi:two-component system, cell cycle sensor histidine kinase and response regulator CckA